MQKHEERKIIEFAGRTYKSKRVMVKDSQSDNKTGDPWHYATRIVYNSGKVVYAIEWGVQVSERGKPVGDPLLYCVHSNISLKQAVFFKHEIMSILRSHPAHVIVKDRRGDTVLVDIEAMLAAGMPDAEFYSDDEREMYGYGLQQPRKVD